MQYHIVNLCMIMIEQEYRGLNSHNSRIDIISQGKIALHTIARMSIFDHQGFDYQKKLAVCYYLLSLLRPHY